MDLPGDTLVDDFCRFLKCSRCGSRDVLTYPQTLRSMGQRRERYSGRGDEDALIGMTYRGVRQRLPDL